MIRKVTIPPELSAEADAYALADHRSFSRLVCEALRQHMNRYPKNRTVPSGHAEIKQIRADLERVKAQVQDMGNRLAEVRAGTFQGNPQEAQ